MSIQRLVNVSLLPTMSSCCGLPCLVVSLVMSGSMGLVFAVPDVPILILITCRNVVDAIGFSVSSLDIVALSSGSTVVLAVSTLGSIASCVAISSDKCSTTDPLNRLVSSDGEFSVIGWSALPMGE